MSLGFSGFTNTVISHRGELNKPNRRSHDANLADGADATASELVTG
jgi:hypothetical protein